MATSRSRYQLAIALAKLAPPDRSTTVDAFDRQLAARALAFTALAGGVALAVVVATDESYSTSEMRFARLCVFAPALSAIGVTAACAQARARGELRALSAIGRAPTRATLGAMVAGWVCCGLAGLGVLTPWVDVGALFPVADTVAPWQPEGDALVSASRHISVDAGGGIAAWEGPAIDPPAPPGRWTAFLAVTSLGLTAPPWAAFRAPALSKLAAAAASVALSVLALHALAADRWPVAAATIGALPLAAGALLAAITERRRAPSAQEPDSS